MNRSPKASSRISRAIPIARAIWPLFLLTGPIWLGGCGMRRTAPCDRIVDHRGKDRLLLVFSPGPADPRLTEQTIEIRNNRSGLRERDMIVYRAVIGGLSDCEGEIVDDETARNIRTHFGVPDDAFQIVLVDKDGTVKLRRLTPTPLWQVFALVDSMPARRSEIRERGGKAAGGAPSN